MTPPDSGEVVCPCARCVNLRNTQTVPVSLPLAQRILAALEDALANARWASQESALRALAAELRAIVERKT